MAFSFHPIFFEKVKILLDTFQKANINYTILSGYRDYQTQKKMYESGAKGVAHPEKSFHVKGRAIDIRFENLEERERARKIIKNLGFHVIDEDWAGYDHLHIDDEGAEKDYYTNQGFQWKPLIMILAAGMGIYYITKEIK